MFCADLDLRGPKPVQVTESRVSCVWVLHGLTLVTLYAVWVRRRACVLRWRAHVRILHLTVHVAMGIAPIVICLMLLHLLRVNRIGARSIRVIVARAAKL